MKKDQQLTADERRTVTPREIADQQTGHTRVAPGIWLDADGDPHVSIPELLAHFDLEDTPTNREEVAAIVAEVMHQYGVVVVRQDPES